MTAASTGDPGSYRVRSDTPFLVCFGILAGAYILLISLLVLVDVAFLFRPVGNQQARIARHDGVVRMEPSDNRTIWIEDDGTVLDEVQVPTTLTTTVVNGETITRGTKLTSGELSGADAMYCALVSPDIRYSIGLSLISCTVSTLLSLLVAVPIGYLMSRFAFPFKSLIDTVLDLSLIHI